MVKPTPPVVSTRHPSKNCEQVRFSWIEFFSIMRRDIHHSFIAGGYIMLSRRDFLKISGAGLLSLYAASRGKFAQRVFAFPIPGGTFDPLSVPKYQTPLLIPPVMPKAGTVKYRGQKIDYYEISMRQFQEQ